MTPVGLVFLLFVIRASALKNLVLFGDFLASRRENNAPYTNCSLPPSPPFSDCRYCNGRVWTEYLNETLPVTNYEVGAATSSNKVIPGVTGLPGRYPLVTVPSLLDQVDAYRGPFNDTIFAVATINDILVNPNASAAVTAGIWAAAIGQLQARGAKSFLIFDYYDVSQIPLVLQTTPEIKTKYRNYSRELSSRLRELHAALPGSYYYSLQETLHKLGFYGNPGQYGYGPFSSYGRCLESFYTTTNWTRCGNASNYVWWDEYHPTTKTHAIIARDIAEVLRR